MAKKIIYARGFPYGAPMAMIRGGGTKDPQVKEFLKGAGFLWDGGLFAWKHYLYHDDFQKVLLTLQDMGCTVEPKKDLPESYLIELGGSANGH